MEIFHTQASLRWSQGQLVAPTQVGCNNKSQRKGWDLTDEFNVCFMTIRHPSCLFLFHA